MTSSARAGDPGGALGVGVHATRRCAPGAATRSRCSACSRSRSPASALGDRARRARRPDRARRREDADRMARTLAERRPRRPRRLAPRRRCAQPGPGCTPRSTSRGRWRLRRGEVRGRTSGWAAARGDARGRRRRRGGAACAYRLGGGTAIYDRSPLSAGSATRTRRPRTCSSLRHVGVDRAAAARAGDRHRPL